MAGLGREQPVQLSLFAAHEPVGPPLRADSRGADAAPASGDRAPGGGPPGRGAPHPLQPSPPRQQQQQQQQQQPPDVFRHPLAEREICLGNRLIGYRLLRARRRSIGFKVGADGLTVSVPRWIGAHDVDSALREKSRWILRKLADQQERSRLQAESRIDWRDGTTIPYLGGSLVVVVDRATTAQPEQASLRTAAGGPPGSPQMTLHLALPDSATAADLRQAVQAWLQRQARKLFEERCVIYAGKIGVRPSRLQLSSAQTRWGSASADGSIRLNWRLIHFSLPTVDYVVAHELAHLREMNHSPRFWAVVRSAFPDFEAVRQQLKAGSVPMFD